MWAWTLFVVLFSLIPFWMEQARGVKESDTAEELPKLLSDLGHAEARTRDAAVGRLLTHKLLTDEQIARTYAAATLPEVRHRLIRIARHRFLKTVKPEAEGRDDFAGSCLGVTFSIVYPVTDPDATPGVMITSTLEGFPAYEKLRVGDMIVGYEGQPLPRGLDIGTFIAIIQRNKPGDLIEFDLMRQEVKQTVAMKLDRTDRMNHVYRDNASLSFKVRVDMKAQLEKMGITLPDASKAVGLQPTVDGAENKPAEERVVP